MFLRHKVRRKDGKEHRYWSIVENRRVAGGRTVQRHVLHGRDQRQPESGMVPDDRSARRGRSTCQTDRAVSRGSRGASAGLRRGACPARGLRLRRPRQWGACWLACHLWDQLRLDALWLARLRTSRQGTPWLSVLKALVCYRLIDPVSEWRLHRQWFDQSAIGHLLGEDFALDGKENLYRCLDKLLVHKADL